MAISNGSIWRKMFRCSSFRFLPHLRKQFYILPLWIVPSTLFFLLLRKWTDISEWITIIQFSTCTCSGFWEYSGWGSLAKTRENMFFCASIPRSSGSRMLNMPEFNTEVVISYLKINCLNMHLSTTYTHVHINIHKFSKCCWTIWSCFEGVSQFT